MLAQKAKVDGCSKRQSQTYCSKSSKKSLRRDETIPTKFKRGLSYEAHYQSKGDAMRLLKIDYDKTKLFQKYVTAGLDGGWIKNLKLRNGQITKFERIR